MLTEHDILECDYKNSRLIGGRATTNLWPELHANSAQTLLAREQTTAGLICTITLVHFQQLLLGDGGEGEGLQAGGNEDFQFDSLSLLQTHIHTHCITRKYEFRFMISEKHLT